MKSMPEDWTPPVDAWQADFDSEITDIVFAYFGIQNQEAIHVSDFEQIFLSAVADDNGPGFVTRGNFVDASGYRNDVFIAYWNGKTTFDSWWDDSDFAQWWADDARLTKKSGIWREIFSVRTERFETLFSSQDSTGAAKLARPFGDPVLEHNYWGGMRDRIADSVEKNDPLASTIGESLPDPAVPVSRGARHLVQLPDNLCLIRSGQNWRDSSEAELETYLDIVRPKLTAGMAFLRDNPEETGCASCRLMDETRLDGSSASQSFGLAMFISMKHLEDWAKSHPTHLAIFSSFFDMLETHKGQIDLKLWHEVLIVDGKTSICEYANCHPRTGLLPYFGQSPA